MRRYVITLVISFALIMTGMMVTVSEVMNYHIANNFENGVLTRNAISYDFTLNNRPLEITSSFANINDIQYDNRLSKGDVKINIIYYNEVIDISKLTLYENGKDTLRIIVNDSDNFDKVKKIFNVTIDGLKHNTVYNYETALKPTVKVFINEADKDAVKIRN